MSEPKLSTNRTRDRWIGFALFGITAVVFSQVLFADFVRFDDDQTIYHNPHIQGLDFDRIYWMLTNADHAVRYKPLSWLAYAIIHQFSGLNPWGYHAANLLFHCTNAALLFVVIRRILRLVNSGSSPAKACNIDLSAAAAALLWSVNPLRVEPVAWVTTFSYGLSFFFLLLSLWYYLHLAPNAAIHRPASFFFKRSAWMFALSMLCYPFAFGYVLLLAALDWYPLQRIDWTKAWWRNPSTRRIAMEKIPFALLGGIIFITYWARTNAIGVWHDLPSTQNLNLFKQALQGCYIWVYYHWKPWLPTNLSPTYHTLISFDPREWIFGFSALVALTLTAIIWWKGRQWRGLLTLWVAHSVLLLSAYGMTERAQVAADRYSYVPGLVWAVLIAVVLAHLVQSGRWRGPAIGATAALIALWSVMSFSQTRHWQNSEVLFNYMLREMGNKHAPYTSTIHGCLGMYYLEQGRTNDALKQFQVSVNSFPDRAGYYSLAGLLEACGNDQAALTNYLKLIELRPDPLAHLRAAALLIKRAETAAAVAHYRKALQLQPDSVAALDQLAWVLATTPDAAYRNGAEAVRLAERACQLTQSQMAKPVETLAAAYAEAGRFVEAIQCGEHAVALAQARGERDLVQRSRKLLEHYRTGRAYREEPAPPSESRRTPK